MGFFNNFFSKKIKELVAIVKSAHISENCLHSLKENLLSIDIGSKEVEEILSQIDTNSVLNLRQQIQDIVFPILNSVKHHFPIETLKESNPAVILFCGINGSGKTTMIAKFCKKLKDQGLNPIIGACDTFRAGAVEQLSVWGDIIGVDIIGLENKIKTVDPASVAYKTIEHAKKNNNNVVVIDTAGRLHNKMNLMKELSKIIRVIKKLIPDAPHYSILTIDAMIGSNTIKQVEIFKDLISINGLVVNKVDTSPKVGVLIPIIKRFKLPIYFLGVGEKETDILGFDINSYLDEIFGLNE